jgi:hypothetical protein
VSSGGGSDLCRRHIDGRVRVRAVAGRLAVWVAAAADQLTDKGLAPAREYQLAAACDRPVCLLAPAAGRIKALEHVRKETIASRRAGATSTVHRPPLRKPQHSCRPASGGGRFHANPRAASAPARSTRRLLGGRPREAHRSDNQSLIGANETSRPTSESNLVGRRQEGFLANVRRTHRPDRSCAALRHLLLRARAPYRTVRAGRPVHLCSLGSLCRRRDAAPPS